MIGNRPVATLAPLDYRYALDAAMTVVAGQHTPALVCVVPDLVDEARQRLPHTVDVQDCHAAIWIEPQVTSWRAELAKLTQGLAPDARLALIVSRPLARFLPEYRTWQSQPLGFQMDGLRKMRRALLDAGFALEAQYGIHTLIAVGLSLLSHQMERFGRPDLADRLHFAARLRYCVTGPLAVGATVTLLIARRGGN